MVSPTEKERDNLPDLGGLADQYFHHENAGKVRNRLATDLGVKTTMLEHLGVGTKDKFSTWPERRGNCVTAITLRPLQPIVSGAKRFEQVPGGKRGLTIPDNLGTKLDLLLICEGGSDTAAALSLGMAAIGIPGAGNCTDLVVSVCLLRKPERVVVVGDADEAGKKSAEKLHAALTAAKFEVITLFPPEGLKDLRDWCATGLTKEVLLAQANSAFEADQKAKDEGTPAPGLYVDKIRALTLTEFRSLVVPKRRVFLDPVLCSAMLMMVVAWRGVGKTMFNLGMALAMATGQPFLRWRAGDSPARVLYLDGELPHHYLLGALNVISNSFPTCEPEDRFRIVAYDCQPSDEMPNIGTPEGQTLVDEMIHAHRADVVIFDSLSTLSSGLIENEGDSNEGFQAWLRHLRKDGLAVELVHHEGKSGDQRGTSRREDQMDVCIALKKPNDYVFGQGARFDVQFTKARGILGDDAQTFQAHLVTDATNCTKSHWDVSLPAVDQLRKIYHLKEQGYPQTKIGEILGVSQSKISRQLKKANSLGKLLKSDSPEILDDSCELDEAKEPNFGPLKDGEE